MAATIRTYQEHDIQNQIIELAKYIPNVQIFRANVGSGYLSHRFKKPDGNYGFTIPRWFSTGLPVGFPDLFGYVSMIVTENMIGKKFAWFTSIECKTPKGRVRPEQLHFDKLFREDGANNSIIRSPEEAIILLKGGCI